MTAGNFYEQFGSVLIFRAYEERGLGYDNAIDGFRLKYKPLPVYTKGLIGRQRTFVSNRRRNCSWLDGEWNINTSHSLPGLQQKHNGLLVAVWWVNTRKIRIQTVNLTFKRGSFLRPFVAWTEAAGVQVQNMREKLMTLLLPMDLFTKMVKHFLLNVGYTKKEWEWPLPQNESTTWVFEVIGIQWEILCW